MREISRTYLHSNENAAESKNPETNDSPTEKGGMNIHNYNNNDAKSISSSSEAKEYQKIKNLGAKPAWALTEEKAEYASDAKTQIEEDELLNFAKSLNYDKYISDMEVKVMMERLRKRIDDLEKDISLEDQRENDAEMRAARREMMELLVSAVFSFACFTDLKPSLICREMSRIH
jgi:hypothetical protein